MESKRKIIEKKVDANGKTIEGMNTSQMNTQTKSSGGFNSAAVKDAAGQPAPAAIEEEETENIKPYVVPKYTSLEWLATECGWIKKKFDPNRIADVFKKIDELRDDYDRIDKLTLVINKRQALLGVTKSDFKELKEI